MKKTLLLALLLILSVSANAQLHGYKWRIGMSAGPTNYFGDIRPMNVNNFQDFTKFYKRYTNYSSQLSYQLSAEYALGNSIGLMLTAGSYQFGSGDRFIKNDGTLFTESPQFDRALNFQTNLYDAGLSFVFKPDNNWLLSGKSFFAPYLVLGLGIQTFTPYGDLLDADGNQYDYTNVNLIPDGTFETKLSNLGTELPGGYKTTTYYAHLGLGFRIRISKQLEFFAQSDFKRAGTDYLDDVSGLYRTEYDNDFQAYAAKPGTNIVTPENPNRGFENLKPDWYIYHGMGIKFSLGANKKSFDPPIISQRYTYMPSELAQKQKLQEEAGQKTEGNNYFTIIQLPNQQSASTSYYNKKIQSELDSLSTVNSVLKQAFTRSSTELLILENNTNLINTNTEVPDSTKQKSLAELKIAENSKKLEVESLSKQLTENEQNITILKNSYQPTSVDTASLLREMLIYPGQVNRILFTEKGPSIELDSTTQKQATQSYSQEGSLTQRQPDQEMEIFRSEMLRSQAAKDSAMVNSFAARTQPETARSTRDVSVISQSMDKKSQRRFQRSLRQKEKLDRRNARRNNKMLKNAALVGGTAAVTAAIVSDNDEEPAEIFASNDSLLLARIAQDSLLIDSLNKRTLIPDTVYQVVVEERILEVRNFKPSKVEVYFDSGKIILTEQEIGKIEEISTLIKENPDFKINLIGFADNTGSISFNLQLTQRRVEYVRDLILEKSGVESERISVSNGGLIIRGPSKSPSDTDRKVEIHLYMEQE